MKKINRFGVLVSMMAITSLFTGCSDQFLKDKQDYDKYTEEVYNDYEGATERVNWLYNNLLPSSTASIGFDTPSAGVSDDYSKSTEEYGGLSQFVDPSVILDNTTVPDYIYRENKNISPYGRIRECNLILAGLKASTLSDAQKKELLGQVYFFRAWCYYRLVKIYGGVPLISQVQNPMIGNTGGTQLVVPRSTTKASIDFICNDLDTAGSYLPTSWPTTNYGRVTAGTALAMQGRARLLYASPLFNRADDQARWELAYQSNKAAIEKLTAGGFGLAYLNAPGRNASGWAKMFSDYTSPEAVFVTLYNSVKTSSGTNYDKNNGWESSIRPYNAGGSGGKNATAQMIDIFPMADGKKPGQSSIAYEDQRFFLNRDPRFYRTFAFPGERWAFSVDPTSLGITTYPYVGSNYALWSYTWYDNAANQAAEDKSGFAADGLGTHNTTVFVRKRTDDLDVNNTPLYIYDTTNKFGLSAAPYMEMRYAEVLLNFAEAACGANHPTEAVAALQAIRQRVGYTSANNFGLDAGLAGDRAKLFAAILYERQIELAYEGKRFDDMRRWLLWDGGVGQAALKSSWALTGFGTNTCTYLGVAPLNGQRRTGVEVQVQAVNVGQAAMANGSDPMTTKGAVRPTPLNLMTDTTALLNANKPIDNLANFYSQYLHRKTTRVDGDPKYTITFQPKYYFIGFRSNMQQMNVTLLQTIGWADLEKGGADGTYDPLAE